MLRIYLRYFFIVFALAIVGCAKRGSITGGLKDTIPPVLRVSTPKNFSTNFDAKEIRLTFDEYVKIKDINKQLIVSPPMKYPPVITPTNASKYISIKIKDTLQPNTTYSFNFGSSIQDNNEGNPYQQFKYVFSTGSYIDSLALGGFIKDAYSKEVANFVSVMLYEVNETFTDSIIYKENPRYITNTLDSAKTFKLENLKEGKYLLVAMKDINNNFRFNPANDQIAFHREFITIPNDTLYELELFKEVLPFKPVRPFQASGNRIVLPYQGNPQKASISLRNGNEILETKVTKFPEKDSLQIWFKPIKVDSLSLKTSLGNTETDFTVKIKNQKNDTLSFNPVQKGTLHFRDRFTINSSLPLTAIDNSKIRLINKDSTNLAFATVYDEYRQELKIDFEKEELQNYSISLLPGALTDFFEKTNDTLNYKLKTQNLAEYANMRVILKNVRQFPVIVQLTNSKGVVIASEYSEENTIINFDGLQPARFTLRLIYDENKNKIWDTGSYLDKRQPEEVIYYKDGPNNDEIDIRANWDWDQIFDLSQ